MGKVAVLMDGGYVVKRLGSHYRRYPTPFDVRRLAGKMAPSRPPAQQLYRVLFYTADPYRGQERHPISGREIDFSTTPLAQNSDWLLDGLEQSPNFAVRRGDLIFRGWRIGESAQRAFEADPTKNLEESDLVPHLVQKGVDMRIGLDIAAMALKRLVNTIVILTGDADMVPAMRLARREGLRVGLCSLGFRGVRSELRAHADFEVKWSP